MPKVTSRQLAQLRPYLVGRPRANGEQDMHCPLHEDEKRSASLNVLTGQWYCHAEGIGGGVLDLIKIKRSWVDPSRASQNGAASRSYNMTLNMGMIEGWHAALLDHESPLDDLHTKRGIHTKTIVDFKIGYDIDKKVYTIPIFGEDGKEILNVRFYDLYARRGRSKIWSAEGWRVTELYPVWLLKDMDDVEILEGEWDTLLTIQNGYNAITKTSGAKTWLEEWSPQFKGKTCYLGGDCDTDGQAANRKIARSLTRVTDDIRLLKLPFEIVPNHGPDMTDFWLKYDREDHERMRREAEQWGKKDVTAPDVITVLDSFDAGKVGDSVKLQVTIKGKKEPGYSVFKRIKLECTQDRGPQCKFCPLNGKNGQDFIEIDADDPVILAMIDERKPTIEHGLISGYGVPGGKCSKLTFEPVEHQSVEILFARPSIDHSDGTQAKDYKNIRITSVGHHDTLPNNTVVVTGALYPNPKDQRNEFLAWNIARQETSVDHFELDDAAIRLMKRFQPRGKQTPLQKLGEINRDFAAHVTRIVGRLEMHALMDLTFHSALSFKFGGQSVERGWLDSLIVGDTRTGKSEAAERLVRHFGAGEIVGGEAATLAGLVGGMQQIAGKDWAVTWGVIPLNDRRLVVIDELSGLHPDEISKMSDVRASGMARLTKILQEVTFARTRLLWLGNPRKGGMDQFTYGVDAIQPLIGNPEDIARFDLAMAVAKGDVPADEFNKPIQAGSLRYTSEACHTLLMWAWTRQPNQIAWGKGAEDVVYKVANSMGSRYVEDPPLVQAANARIKIARVAVALAARTFATDSTNEALVVTRAHVEDAVRFMDRIYNMDAFGYAERSRERIEDLEQAIENRGQTRDFLHDNKGLAKFLRSNPHFRRQDIEEVLNKDRDGANGIINVLWRSRMIRKEGADIKVEPTLHELLREVRW